MRRTNGFQHPRNGWWNCIVADDFDKDGDVDFMAGNYGLNNQFRVSSARSRHISI